MKNKIKIMCTFVLFISFVLAVSARAEDSKYVGSSVCKACHNTDKMGKQYDIWSKSKHAKAIEVLKSEAANKIAKEKGLKTSAVEAPECLACHVAGGWKNPAIYDAKFSKDEGVGCEGCHGAGSGYKTKHQKKEKLEEAKKAGMKLLKVADGSAEKHCLTCHNAKSPTYKEFKFAAQWDKIKHPKPPAK